MTEETKGNGKDEVVEKLDQLLEAIEVVNDQLAEISERLADLEGNYGYSNFDSSANIESNKDYTELGMDRSYLGPS